MVVNLCGELIRLVIKLFASNLSSTLEPLCVSALESFMIAVSEIFEIDSPWFDFKPISFLSYCSFEIFCVNV